LLINAFATYNLRNDVADLDARLSSSISSMQAEQVITKKNINKVSEDATLQLAEHERLIGQLENMMNYQLDN
jgi:hypothetical protein